MATSKDLWHELGSYPQQAVQWWLSKSSDDLKRAAKIVSISLATYVVVNKLYKGFFGPLSSVPGPFWSRFIPYSRLFFNRPSGTDYKVFLEYHSKYGDIVRMGPQFVTVADKDMIKQILLTDDFPKAPIYKIFQRKGTATLFSTTDAVWHKKRRRIVSPAFSIKYLQSLEPFVVNVTESLVHKIDSEIANSHDELGYGTIDIWNLVQRLALDVIGETAFGKTFNMVQDNSHFVPEAISKEMRKAAISGMFPLLAKIFYPSSTKTDVNLEQFLANVIKDRLKPLSEKRKDILQFLIDVQQAAETDTNLTSEAIMAETTLFLIAGSETTSNTIGFAFFELLCHPEKLKSLYEELDALQLEQDQTVFHNEQLKSLPYLNAVINETLRLDTIAALGLLRIAPKDTVLSGQTLIPKNTVVNCNVYYAQMNEKYWHNPLDFVPERWIDGEHPTSNSDDLDAFFPFSIGSRNCIGKNFALQEMRIAIATLLRAFEIKPIEQEMTRAQDRRHFITLTVPNNTFSIKMKRRV